MRVIDVIAEADSIRPNAVDDEMKLRWLLQLEQDYAEVTEAEDFDINAIDFETVLIMPKPHDYSYVWYLCAMIDYYNQDTGLYMNDMQLANDAIDNAKAFYNRNHRSMKKGNWKTMYYDTAPEKYDPLDLNKG